MGTATDLGYEHRPPRAFQRAVQAAAATRPGGWVFARTLRHLDDLVARVTRGRHSAPDLLAGLPVVDVTTTGRRSGQPRRTHLISIPVGDDLALLGTNFGQPATPAWVHNLEADPRATVTYRSTTAAVVARPATPAEREQVLATAAGIYGGYLKYLERVQRRVRIFVLEAATEVNGA